MTKLTPGIGDKGDVAPLGYHSASHILSLIKAYKLAHKPTLDDNEISESVIREYILRRFK